jgi:predicted small secreted protein
MKNLLFSIFSLTIILLAACSGAGSDPKVAAKAFYEALGKKDYDKAAQYATKDSKTLLDLIKSMSEMGGQMNVETDMTSEEKIKNAVYSTAEIDGDKAVVKVSTGE